MTENHGGSCEPCKRKKCKCDRQLPSCGQCEISKLPCTYGESTKRGIPTGYLGLLEQRLGETEVLLYRALSELRALKLQQNSYPGVTSTLDIPDPITREANAPKPVRMEEWKEYPLKYEEEVERWRQYMSGGRETSIGYDEGFSGEQSQVNNSYYSNPTNQFSNPDPSQTYHDTDMDFNVAAGLVGLSQSHGQIQLQTQNTNNAHIPPPSQHTNVLNPRFSNPMPPLPDSANNPSLQSNYTAEFNSSKDLHINRGISNQNLDLDQNPQTNAILEGSSSNTAVGWETPPSDPTSGATGQNAGTQRPVELLRSQQLSAAFKNIYY
ncbi:hypothetical protein ONS96_001352 [Cadophora gregata f. sp. sojae]|nr:hypothetical protein ONS96_001352 [Cadophora gregata f. sp. sojae]